jgi:beta-galactosidase
MIQAMRDRNLEPIITLNHFTLPLWVLTPPLEFKKIFGQKFFPKPLSHLPFSDPPDYDPYWKSLRGWENNETVKEFVKYVSVVVLALKDLVDIWITINEPTTTLASLGYIAGLWPPGFFLDGNRLKTVTHNLIDAHVLAYDAISSIDNVDADGDGIAKKVGLSHLMMEVVPAYTRIPLVFQNLNKKAAENFDYFMNDYFMNAIINGVEDINYLETLKIQDRNSPNFIVHEHWKNKLDFIGLNYYRRVHIFYNFVLSLSSARFVGGLFLNDPNVNGNKVQLQEQISDLGWEIYPEGVYNLIMRITKKWNKPIIITENGIADKSDRIRAPFIISHLQQIRQSIDDGARVVGYLHWSLTDNYEWQDGYNNRASFGLYSINRNDDSLDRKVTKGAQVLELILKESKSNNDDKNISRSALAKAASLFGTFTKDGSKIVYK